MRRARSRRLSAVLVAAVLAAGQGAASQRQSGSVLPPPNQRPFQFPAPETTSLGGVVIGTVIDASTGRGVPNAAVVLRGPETATAIATDPLGRYYFVALPPGEYEISAEKPGYVPGRYGQLRAAGPARPLSLERDQWRVDGNVTLWKQAAIEGLVTDEAGEGVVGVRVHALRRDYDDAGPTIAAIDTTLTDDRGQFRIGNLVPGEYLVMTPSVQTTIPLAEMERIADTGRGGGAVIALTGILDSRAPEETKPGRFAAENIVPVSDEFLAMRGRMAEPPPPRDGQAYVYPSQYYPATDIPSLAMPITLDAGQQFFGAAFALRAVPAATVTGVVMGPAGPVQGQLLRLVPDTGEDFGTGFEAAATMTSDDGRFTFLDVPPGSYVIEARSTTSLAALSPSPEPILMPDGVPPPVQPRDQWWSRTPISVFGDDIDDLVVTMRPTHSVTGQITFVTTGRRPTTAEVDRIRVSLKPARGGRAGVPDARVQATGSFALRGLWPAEYFVDTTLPAGWFIESIQGQGRDLTSDPLDASMGGDTIVVAVRLTNTPTRLSGTVRDERGAVVGDVTVVALPADRATLSPLRTREVRASAYGEFVFAGLPPGAYHLVALSGREAGSWREPSTRAAVRAAAVRVALGTGEGIVRDLRVRRR